MTIEEILAGESKNVEFKEKLSDKSIKYMKSDYGVSNSAGQEKFLSKWSKRGGWIRKVLPEVLFMWLTWKGSNDYGASASRSLQEKASVFALNFTVAYQSQVEHVAVNRRGVGSSPTRGDLRIAGCWSHARRRFDEAVKALPKAKQKDSRAYLALTMIQAICREEKQLKELRNSNHVLVTENRPGLRCTSYLIFLSAEVADCVSVGERSAGCGSNALWDKKGPILLL